MTEKIQINGADIWIVIEPHQTHMAGDERKEYFTASYHPIDPVIDPAGDTFLDNEHHPVAFCSPEEAIAYAHEKLAGRIDGGVVESCSNYCYWNIAHNKDISLLKQDVLIPHQQKKEPPLGDPSLNNQHATIIDLNLL